LTDRFGLGVVTEQNREFYASLGINVDEYLANGGKAPKPVRVSKKYDVCVLPGHGQKGSFWCGDWRVLACTNIEGHNHERLDGFDVSNKAIVELYKASCGEISCPVCMEKAIGKMASKIEFRLNVWPQGPVYHYVVSVPKEQYSEDIRDLRSLAEKYALSVGVRGGIIIFHPWRLKCAQCGSEVEREGNSHICMQCGCDKTVWIVGLHFHIVGTGRTDGARVKLLSERTGWFVRNLGRRRTIKGTIHYQLSHCGVSKGFSTVVWFGIYAKHKFPMMPAEEHLCPVCEAPMSRVPVPDSLALLMKSDSSELLFEGVFAVDQSFLDVGDGG
jgi:hypothetical protein